MVKKYIFSFNNCPQKGVLTTLIQKKRLSPKPNATYFLFFVDFELKRCGGLTFVGLQYLLNFVVV